MQTVKGYLGSVSFDGQTVVIEKKLRGATRIPLSAIQAIGIERAGLGMKGVRFSVAGGTLAQASVAMGSHRDLAQDPYALTFRSGSLGKFQELVGQIEAARA